MPFSGPAWCTGPCDSTEKYFRSNTSSPFLYFKRFISLAIYTLGRTRGPLLRHGRRMAPTNPSVISIVTVDVLNLALGEQKTNLIYESVQATVLKGAASYFRHRAGESSLRSIDTSLNYLIANKTCARARARSNTINADVINRRAIESPRYFQLSMIHFVIRSHSFLPSKRAARINARNVRLIEFQTKRSSTMVTSGVGSGRAPWIAVE